MIGEVLIAFLVRLSSSPSTVRRLGNWLREVSRPPQRIELRADDGTIYSGLVLVKSNVVAAALVLDASRLTGRYQDHRSGPLFERSPYFYSDDDQL